MKRKRQTSEKKTFCKSTFLPLTKGLCSKRYMFFTIGHGSYQPLNFLHVSLNLSIMNEENAYKVIIEVNPASMVFVNLHLL